MPTLITEFEGARCGAVLRTRVLIGRKAACHLAFDDPAVSRLHAWIEPRNGGWYIGDAGSVNGVCVNGRRIERGRVLADGDVIDIGPVRLTFHAADQLPRGIRLLDLERAGTAVDGDRTGAVVTCACGAPAWVARRRGRQPRLCTHCGMILPDPPAAPAAPAESASPAEPAVVCSICQCPILAGEDRHTCPECGLVFHEPCWRENLGCSAYGCPQVNVLAPTPPPPRLTIAQPVFPDYVSEPQRTPWEYLLLASAVVGTVLGTLSFGGPALVVAIAALCLLIGRRFQRRSVLVASLFLSLLGAGGGIFTSWLWWMR